MEFPPRFFKNGSFHSVRFTIVKFDNIDHKPLVLPGFVMDQETFLETEAGYDLAWEHDDAPYLRVDSDCLTLGPGEADDPTTDELEWLVQHFPEYIHEAELAAGALFTVENPFYFETEEG